MNRYLALRTSIAALAILPAFTACSMVPGIGKTEATPQQANVAPQDAGNSSKNNNGADQSRDTTDSNDDSANDDDSNANDDSDTNASNNGSDDSGDDGSSTDGGSTGQDSNDDSTGTNDGGSDADSSSDDSTGDDGASGNSQDGSTSTGKGSGSSNTGSSTSGNSHTNSSSSGNRQRIQVPAGSGISRLELLDIYGGRSSSTDYGQVVAVFKATTDRPMMLNIRITLYDASGKQIATNTGLNSVYTTGSHDLVTKNLIKVPAGAKPKSFKASFVDKTDLTSGPRVSNVSTPEVGQSPKFDNLQVLTGTARVSGSVGSNSVEADGACITSDGKIYHGAMSITDKDVSGGRVEYSIPMYDAKGVDLARATCYVSI
ncbi:MULTISPECIES: hypothetical protein [unclassified Luteococcus]|uniref:hypothetical protein n=1 Tax=unclassified Luteococcus TaxID=2639923 RepID=UPI00313B53A0